MFKLKCIYIKNKNAVLSPESCVKALPVTALKLYVRITGLELFR